MGTPLENKTKNSLLIKSVHSLFDQAVDGLIALDHSNGKNTNTLEEIKRVLDSPDYYEPIALQHDSTRCVFLYELNILMQSHRNLLDNRDWITRYIERAARIRHKEQTNLDQHKIQPS